MKRRVLVPLISAIFIFISCSNDSITPTTLETKDNISNTQNNNTPESDDESDSGNIDATDSDNSEEGENTPIDNDVVEDNSPEGDTNTPPDEDVSDSNTDSNDSENSEGSNDDETTEDNDSSEESDPNTEEATLFDKWWYSENGSSYDLYISSDGYFEIIHIIGLGDTGTWEWVNNEQTIIRFTVIPGGSNIINEFWIELIDIQLNTITLKFSSDGINYSNPYSYLDTQ